MVTYILFCLFVCVCVCVCFPLLFSLKFVTEQMESKLRYLVQFHALITAVDLITHCDLTTAILHLSAVQDKYGNILQGNSSESGQSMMNECQ